VAVILLSRVVVEEDAMSDSLGDNKFFKFANCAVNVMLVIVGILLFLAVFHLINMRSTAVSVILCVLMLMTSVAVGCAIVADIQMKRKKNIGNGLSENGDAASSRDGESVAILSPTNAT
jgi:protein-S-isoprenylcysteine O-methyltransferase Ste14